MKKQPTKKTQNQHQAKKQNSHSSSDEQLTFLEHIYELRSRLFWVVATLILTSSVGLYYKDILVDFIVAPLNGEKLIYLTPGGGFSFIFTVCLYFGALVTIPVIMYHIYRFLQPVLGKTSRRLIVAIIVLSCLLASSGAIFGYVVAIPAAITFLTTFAGDAVAPSLTAESYLGFVVAYMLGLAVLFQLPLLLFMFDHVKPFPPGALLSSQRFVIVGAVIAAAIITPTPDIINQLIIATPIIAIYQLGAIAVYVRRRARRRASQRNTPSVILPNKPTRAVSYDAIASEVPKITPTQVAAEPILPLASNTQSGFRRASVTVPARSIDDIRRRPALSREQVVQKESVRKAGMRTTDGFVVVGQNS